jgi:PAS domain-containing protein
MPRWTTSLRRCAGRAKDSLLVRALALIVVSSLPGTVILASTLHHAERSLEHNALDSANRIARLTAREIGALFASTERTLDLLRVIPEVDRATPEQCNQILRCALSSRPRLTGLWVTDQAGSEICNSSATTNLDRSGRDDFQRATAGANFAIGDPRIGTLSATAVVPISSARRDSDGRMVGTIGAGIDLKYLDELTAALDLPPDATVSVWTGDRRMVYRNVNPELYIGKPTPPTRALDLFERDPNAKLVLQGFDGVARMFGASRLTAVDLTVIVGFEASRVLAPIDNEIPALAAAAAASYLLLLGPLAASFRQGILVPIHAAIAGLRGDSPADSRRGDFARFQRNELGRLAHHLHRTGETLRRRKRALRAVNQRLHAIMNSTINGLVTIDERGSILTFSQPAERIFGYTAAEVLGKNVNILMPEPYKSQHDR